MQLVYILSMLMVMNLGMPQQKKDVSKSKMEKVKAGFGVSVVQTQPEFPGGADSLVAFVSKNVSYPKTSQRAGAEGRVYVGFLVDKEGKIKNPRLLSGINEELDSEAMRIVALMPDWTPGTVAGTNVDVQYIIPVDFILPK